MKIDKKMLLQIIKEEADKLASADARTAGMDASRQMGASGIDDKERAIIVDFLKIMQKAAASGNLASGIPATKISQLADILNKLSGTSPAAAAGSAETTEE
jgi:hypothetical protein